MVGGLGLEVLGDWNWKCWGIETGTGIGDWDGFTGCCKYRYVLLYVKSL